MDNKIEKDPPENESSDSSIPQEIWEQLSDSRITGKYLVSNLGRVKNISLGKILYQSLSNSGYCFVSVTGKHLKFYIHRLVAEAFIGRTKGMEINHLDGNKQNNTISNLEITTSSGNKKHAYKVLGIRPHNIKLTKEIAEKVRREYAYGDLSQKKVAELFGVSTMLVNRIINRVQREYR